MKRYPAVQEKVVVVTGASTGIGRATARLLKSRGWRVLPTARSRTDLDLLRGEGFQPVELDLADADSVARAAREILELAGGKLGAVVNNAGRAVGSSGLGPASTGSLVTSASLPRLLPGVPR